MKLVIFTETDIKEHNLEDIVEHATSVVDTGSLKEQAEEDFISGSKIGGVSQLELDEIQSDEFVDEFLKSIADGDSFTLTRLIHDAYQNTILEQMSNKE